MPRSWQGRAGAPDRDGSDSQLALAPRLLRVPYRLALCWHRPCLLNAGPERAEPSLPGSGLALRLAHQPLTQASVEAGEDEAAQGQCPGLRGLQPGWAQADQRGDKGKASKDKTRLESSQPAAPGAETPRLGFEAGTWPLLMSPGSWTAPVP